MLGPVLPQVARIRNKYSCQILVKYRNEPALDDPLDTVEKYSADAIYVNVDKSPMVEERNDEHRLFGNHGIRGSDPSNVDPSSIPSSSS
ncbi:MAG: hypothetical protein MZU97_07070 [Bacillus subtilis]|nr:hypothetical protein [Bacillus subtilis]